MEYDVIKKLAKHVKVKVIVCADGSTCVHGSNIILYSDRHYRMYNTPSLGVMKVINLRVYLKLWRLFNHD